MSHCHAKGSRNVFGGRSPSSLLPNYSFSPERGERITYARRSLSLVYLSDESNPILGRSIHFEDSGLLMQMASEKWFDSKSIVEFVDRVSVSRGGEEICTRSIRTVFNDKIRKILINRKG